jgi:acetylglutamate kinase
VIKLGGNALEGADAVATLATELAALEQPAIVVHGGGGEVSAWCARLGIAPRFADGLRVTDPPTLEVVTAVLGGLAHHRLVAGLRAHGVDAVGLSALDGGIAEVEPHPDAATLGAVGQVRAIRPALLEQLLAAGRLPVLASVGADRGALLNLNADELAGAVAAALHAPGLLLFSDVPGLELDGRLIDRVAARDIPGLLEHPDVRGGMRPKLRAAAAALAGGVARVHIGSWRGQGTLAAACAERALGTRLTTEAWT